MCYSTEGEGWLGVYCPPGGSPAKLPLPPNAGPQGAKATAVNDAGVVVGFSYQGTSGSLEVGCIWWPDGTVQEIPPAPGGTSSPAYAVNGLGLVVGGSGNKPYQWYDGVMTIMEVPAPFESGNAWRVADAGFVIGTVGNAATTGRAYRWKGNDITLLEPVGAHTASRGLGVNNLGWVVGDSRTYLGLGFGYAQTPTLWTESGSFALPMPSGFTNGAASSVNDQGQIIGTIGGLSGQGIPSTSVIWINGVCYPINDLTAPGSPVVASLVGLTHSGSMLTGGAVKLLSPISSAVHDLNGDCAVDGSDLMKLLSEWGPRDWSVADLNHDGIVNGADLAQVLGNWTSSK